MRDMNSCINLLCRARYNRLIAQMHCVDRALGIPFQKCGYGFLKWLLKGFDQCTIYGILGDYLNLCF